MTHTKRKPLGGTSGEGQLSDIKMSKTNTDILPQNRPHRKKPRNYRPPTERQINYLMMARRIVGLPLWNAIKKQLGITRPGIYGLTFSEAYRLIGHIDNLLDQEAAAR